MLKSLREIRLLLQPHDVSISVTLTTTLAERPNTIDHPAWSLTAVGLTCTATLAPTVHRHGLVHHLRGRPLKPGLVWLARKWLGRTIQDRGPAGHDPEEDAGACVEQRLKMVRIPPAGSES